jgi:hypothetical protein
MMQSMDADPSYAYEGEIAPAAPVARVVGIVRGRVPRTPGSCEDAGVITIAVRDDSVRGYHGYEFRQASGYSPDAIFPSGAFFGGAKDGELLFDFYWLDLPHNNRRKIDLVVTITPVTRSGLVGMPTELRVAEDGL